MASRTSLYLQDVLDAKFGAGKTKVILPITDPYVVHHGALGSFATVYAYGPAVTDMMAVIASAGRHRRRARQARTAAPASNCRRTAWATSSSSPAGPRAPRSSAPRATSMISPGLNEPLRSHGGLTEQEIPVIANRKFKDAARAAPQLRCLRARLQPYRGGLSMNVRSNQAPHHQGIDADRRQEGRCRGRRAGALSLHQRSDRHRARRPRRTCRAGLRHRRATTSRS